MEDVRIMARDGLELVAYLTRAVKEEEKEKVKTPLILLVHGGPWARDSWGFNTQAQWFANRGYATLQVRCMLLVNDSVCILLHIQLFFCML